jgi:DNA-binding MarR family transcriptional regulator
VTSATADDPAARAAALQDAAEELRRILPRWELVALYRMRDLAARHDLTLNELALLTELLLRSRPLDGASAAEALCMATGGTARLLARLEERDLVVRDPDPGDGRRLLVSASEEAHGLLWHDLTDVDATRLFAVVPTGRIGWVTAFLGRLTDLGLRRVRALQDRRAGEQRRRR